MKKHPHISENMLEEIINIIKKPQVIRKSEEDENVCYFYKEHKEMESNERYLFVSVKYLNNHGFVITSFFTNKIMGI